MLELIKKHSGGSSVGQPELTVILDYDQRSKGRLRAISTDGQDLGLFLERGKVLRDGDVLESRDGTLVLVKAADEQLLEAYCDDWETFAKCCYHLGNRHVPVQIFDKSLRMRPDHILEDMINQLGMHTKHIEKGFDPEQGAYSGGHSHSHGHSHGHSNDHSHGHAHDH